MTTTSEHPDVHPGSIIGTAAGHWQARMLHSAVELGVFTALSRTRATAREVAAELGLIESGTRALLIGLAHLGLLEENDGVFGNSPATEAYLVRDTDSYLGGYLNFVNTGMNPAWDGLADSLRTGQPQNPAARNGNPYDDLYQSADAVDAFMDSMDVLNTPVGLAMSEFDWQDYSSFADIGGARGNFAHQVITKNPHLRGTVFDLPPVGPAFDRHIRRLGGPAADAIDFVGGDFFVDDMPTADVLVFGHVLHNWSVEDRKNLLARAYDALPSGGAVLVYDPMSDDDGQPGLNAVLAGLTMLVWSRGGHEYSVSELRDLLTETGFRPEVVDAPKLHDDQLVLGHKD